MVRRQNISRQTLLVLTHLAERPQDWWYGYDVMGSTGIKSGTLYPMLVRLHDQGYLEARWVESTKPGRPKRHAYRLTAAGLNLAQSSSDAERGSGRDQSGALA